MHIFTSRLLFWAAGAVAIGIVLSAQSASADFIGPGDFVDPVVYNFQDLPFSFPAQLQAPVTVGPFTFTSDTGFIGWGSTFLGPDSRGISTTDGLGFLDISISPGVQKFGFYMSAGGQAEPIVAIVSFYGPDGLLGSKTYSADGLGDGSLFGGGGLFAGFYDPNGIDHVVIQDIFKDSAAIAVNDLEFEAPVPLPASLPLFASGLAGLGWLARRRKRQVATA